jgi:hypothetical protein
MTRKLVTATVTIALLAAGASGAQPYPGGRHLGNPGRDDARAANGCYRGERPSDCRQRLQAERRSQHRYVYRDGRYEQQDNGGSAVAAGILGFILGAAIAGSSHDRDYYTTHKSDNGWKFRCRAAYRSFDVRTGTYAGTDGYRHYCVR